MKSTIIELLATELKNKLSADDISRLVEVPPSPDMGDFAFPCFTLSRHLKKSPVLIAEEIRLSASRSLCRAACMTFSNDI